MPVDEVAPDYSNYGPLKALGGGGRACSASGR